MASNITPSLTVQLDPARVVGIATDHGTRTSHWAILARSLSIPAVVGLGDITHPFYMPAGELRVLDPDGYVVLVGRLS